MKKTLGAIHSTSPKLIRFAGLECIFWAAFSAYYPFLVVYMDGKGMNNTTIGFILSINSFVVVLAQPFWGMVSDWMQSIRKVFVLCLIIATGLWLSQPLYHSVVLIGLVFALTTFFESPLSPLLDSWLIQGIRTEGGVAYGTIRLWGSIGYAIMVYINGKCIDSYGIWILFPSFAILAAATLIICAGIPANKDAAVRSLKNLKVGKLLKNYRYMTFIIFATFLFIPHRSSFLFLPRIVEFIGGGKELLGLSLSVIAISEIPVFLFSGYLIRRFKPIHLILVSSVFFIIRQLLFFTAVQPVHVFVVLALHGPSFALFLAGAVYYIDSLTPDELKSTAQTLGSAVYAGISGIVGSYGGGWLIDHYGLKQLYHIGIYLSLGISLLFLLSLWVEKRSGCSHTGEVQENVHLE